MGSPWYDCANAVRARAGWRCECDGACGTHAERCPHQHGRWQPDPPDGLPAFARVFAVHRTDTDCLTPMPGACQMPAHYHALCHRCRPILGAATITRAAVAAGLADLRCALCVLETGHGSVHSLGGAHVTPGTVPTDVAGIVAALQAKRRAGSA